MTYRVTIARGAAKAFRGLHPQVAARLKATIQALAEDPRPPGSLQLSGGDGEFRIRVGDYRIIYDVQDDELRSSRHWCAVALLRLRNVGEFRLNVSRY